MAVVRSYHDLRYTNINIQYIINRVVTNDRDIDF